MGIFKDKLKAAFASIFIKYDKKNLESLSVDLKSIKVNDLTTSFNFKKSTSIHHKIEDKKIIPTNTNEVKPKSVNPFITADLVMQADAKISYSTEIISNHQLLQTSEQLGCQNSIHKSSKVEQRELSIGLDFGTSSVKVVIGDHGSDQSYAVPFFKTTGIDSYLLPSRVFLNTQMDSPQLSDRFSLEKSELAYRDLKLGLLGSPFDRERQKQVIAFLSQVIHRSRSWLFSNHSSIYKNINCLWRLRVGLPAASSLDNKFVPIFTKIAHASWMLADLTGSPSVEQTIKIRDLVFDQDKRVEDLEVEIIPEIAAQIYGFVVSSSFDKKAPNRYLMVDVGAGTVDASLFKVVPVRGGKWDFEFYTAVIQPYGVSNLHFTRVDWWLKNLPDTNLGLQLKTDLNRSKLSTDLGFQLPDHCEDYIKGVSFKRNSPATCDYEFFDKKITSQVQGSAMWRAYKDGYLTQNQLKDIPMFLCGGGSRNRFYEGLEKLVQHPPSFSWLSVQLLKLTFPKDLIAEGVATEDFDRLSVAYGLSRLEVGKVTKAIPEPKVTQVLVSPFVDRFIDKDQC